MYLKPIVEMDIFKIIDKFNPNKGVGNDNIGDFIVKKKKKKKKQQMKSWSLLQWYLIYQFQRGLFQKI